MTAFSFLLLFFFLYVVTAYHSRSFSVFLTSFSFSAFYLRTKQQHKTSLRRDKERGLSLFFFLNVSFLLPQLVFVSLFLFLLDADRSQQRVPAACLIQKNTRCSSFFFFCCCCFDYTIALLQQRFSVDRPLLLLLFLLLLSLFLRQL